MLSLECLELKFLYFLSSCRNYAAAGQFPLRIGAFHMRHDILNSFISLFSVNLIHKSIIFKRITRSEKLYSLKARNKQTQRTKTSSLVYSINMQGRWCTTDDSITTAFLLAVFLHYSLLGSPSVYIFFHFLPLCLAKLSLPC